MKSLRNPDRFIGVSPDQIPLKERAALTGKWIALELYSPRTLPLRVIAAIGETPVECAGSLAARGLDPTNYEYVPLKPPY
ncbi:MAG: hypothetical protein HYZ57_04775 [Acidobacteria bacterium]|nr:hypothetical protein [Acidobacteriota bacterium]MBI3279138.1 hypothetical protein [Acidobacteriota bacterium]